MDEIYESIIISFKENIVGIASFVLLVKLHVWVFGVKGGHIPVPAELFARKKVRARPKEGNHRKSKLCQMFLSSNVVN